MREITYSKDALRVLRRIPVNIAVMIRVKIELYASNPDALASNVIQMKGREGYFRLRVGDWRVIFGDDGVVIAVIKIGPRGGVYD